MLARCRLSPSYTEGLVTIHLFVQTSRSAENMKRDEEKEEDSGSRRRGPQQRVARFRTAMGRLVCAAP